VITRLSRRLRRDNPGELTITQWSALMTVDEQGPLRIGDVGLFERVSPPTATRLVASLEAGGWVSRTVDATDRRIAWVAVTDAGKELLATARHNRTALVRRLLDGFDAGDRERFEELLPLLENLAAASEA
jgi:DNA-binding MarR family transcriptional regulator